MGFVGIEEVKVGIKTLDGKLITGKNGLTDNGILTIDSTNYLGTSKASITGLEGSATEVFGNNQKVDVTYGNAPIKVGLTVNNFLLEPKMKLLGYKEGDHGDFQKTTHQRSCALIKTLAINSSNVVYFGFPLGTFSESAVNLQTNTQTEQRAEDELTFDALNSNDINSAKMKVYYSGNPNFSYDKMIEDIFGVQPSTPTVSS